MFQKKQWIYSATQGACRVDNIVTLSVKKGEPLLYYVLKPLSSELAVSYIPVKGHEVKLRELFTVEEATELKKTEEYEKNIRIKEAVDFVLQEGE